MARKGENIFKRKDGRWEGRYIKERRDGKAVYGYVFGKSYLEAKEKKAKAILDITQEANRQEKSVDQPLIREIGTKWLEELKPIRKKSTVVKYIKQLEKYIYPYFGELKINEVTNDDLIAFRNALLIGDENGNGKLAPKTVADIFSRMKSLHKFAITHGWDAGYVTECVSIPQTLGKTRILSLEEEETLVRYLKKHLGLTNLGIILSLFTGIRIGELCALTWNDISLPDQEIHIRKTMQRLQNLEENPEAKTFIDIDVPKSKCSIRTIPIPDNVMEDLQAAYSEGAYFLTGRSDRFVEPRTMENRFKVVLRECGIKDRNFHSLRHTFATRCVEVGFDIKSLSEILGHANVNITLNRYVHPTMKLKRENMQKLSGLFAVK